MLASKASAKKCEYVLWLSLLSIHVVFDVVVSVYEKFHKYHEMKKYRHVEESDCPVSDLCPRRESLQSFSIHDFLGYLEVPENVPLDPKALLGALVSTPRSRML